MATVELLDKIIDNVAGNVLVLDRGLRVVHASERAARLLGKDRSELVGAGWADVAPHEVRAREDLLARAFADEQVARAEAQFITAKGTRWYEYVIRPARNASGVVQWLVITSRDVTDRRVAQRRSEGLQALTVTLNAAVTDEAIAETVIHEAHEALGAAASVAYFFDERGVLRLAAHRGIAPVTAVRLATLPLDSMLPLAITVREQQAQWVGNREEMLKLFPAVASTATPVEVVQAFVALPLTLGESRYGGVAFSFDRPCAFDVPYRQYVNAMMAQCAQALERARLYREEQRARSRAALLADASRRMSEASLDLGVVLDTTCRIVVERLPESCSVLLLDEARERLELLAVHHQNPEIEESIRLTLAGAPVRVGEGMLGRVAQTGETLLVEDIPFEALRRLTKPEYLAHLERYPFKSLIAAPLRARGSVLGVIVASRAGGDPFRADDRLLLEELAARAATSIENAHLFKAEQDARRLRDDFLSIAGHELRTPLAALNLQIDLLARQASRIANDEAAEQLVGRAHKTTLQIRRLETLVNQLLDVSRISAGPIALERALVDLGNVVSDVGERFKEHARRVGSELRLVLEPSVAGNWDALRIEQVITNLLSNALKYGASKPVEVTLERQDRGARLQVRDHGIGIDAASRERIFGRFERAVSDRHYGGLGLGLWISQQIVIAHGGSIACASEVGQGTTFTVDLPFGTAS
jgi:PAS domain S-box-containing protein